MTSEVKPTKSAIWAGVITERHGLIAELQTLDAEHWAAPTACEGWSVHDVVAHLVHTARTTRVSFVRELLSARFDFDRANQAGVDRTRRARPQDTLTDFTAVAEARTGPPAALGTRLVEAFVHSEDIRRAIGSTTPRAYPIPLVIAALKYQAAASASMGGGREITKGLRLVATDADLILGAGALVEGSALALLLAASGRPTQPGELTGEGASLLASRIAAAGAASADAQDQGRDLWAVIHAERAALVRDLERLDAGQWRHATLCGDWDVQHVAAHLTAAASVGRIAWLRSVIGARFNFAVHNDRRLAEHIGTSPQETLDNLRAVTHSTTAASGATPAWLGEVIVHGQDIREPLGISTAPATEAVLEVARFYASRDFTVPSKSAIAGLRLEATDAAFTAGVNGDPLVRGPVVALVMTMAGRAAYLDRLEGEGVKTLRMRTT